MNLGSSSGASDIWSLTNVYSPSANNGNMLNQNLTFLAGSTSTTIGTVYTYDGINRLSIAAENSSNPSNPLCATTTSNWCRQYSYVSNGNRLTSASSGQGLSPDEPGSFNSSNQISSTGWTYDARGNVTRQTDGSTMT